MKPMIVTKDRFLYEMKNHLDPNTSKRVNWMVVEEGIKFYLFAAYGNEVFLYIHKGTVEDLPVRLQEAINPKGEILGFEEDDDSEEVVEAVNELSKKIQTRVIYND